MSQLKQAARSPLFFREVVEIERVLLLMAVILIFRCTEGAGVGEGLDSVQLKIKMAPSNFEKPQVPLC